ncbi:MAG: hypothetical protein LUI39_02325 [Lachnospiraceae bacterium]|nr:hypothetical protein [Lachnospiraceae bacterium]
MNSIFQLSNVQFLAEAFLSSISGIKEFALLYLFCILVFFFFRKKYLNAAFGWPFIFMCLTIFNPFVIVPLSELIGLTDRIRRIFWLLPINLVLACSFTCILTIAPHENFFRGPAHHNGLKTSHPAAVLWQKRMNYASRTAIFICIVAAVAVFGNSVIPHMQLSHNIYKVDDTILEIADILNEDSDETGLEKVVLYSDTSLLELRVYDASISGALDRHELLSYSPNISDEEAIQKTVKQVIQSRAWLYLMTLVSRFHLEVDTDAFRTACQAYNVNYIIMHSDDGMGTFYEEAGCSLIGSAGDYEVYRINP